MAARLPRRSVAPLVALLLAALLLAAGAGPGGSAHAGTGKAGKRGVSKQGPRTHARLGRARALVGANRCLARSWARQSAKQRRRARRAARLRRRCGRQRAKRVLHTPQPLYWGATIGSHLTGDQAPWDMDAVAAFERGAGKSTSMIQFFQPFAQCDPECSFYSFPTTPLDDIRAHGAIPVLSWSSQSIPSSLSQPDFQLSDVISGRYDTYIAEFATAARDWGHPFFLRFNWEMNGDWFSWSEGVNGNAEGEYVAAWRRVHDIYRSVGADNVSWVWCPFVDPAGSLQDVTGLYPGDAYVDWTCLDGYNWGTNPASPRGWKSFDQLFRRSYDEIAALAPAKPMMLGEIGSSEHGGSKADWIRDTLTRIPSEYPRIRAMLWFDKFDDDMDWPVETSTAATTAFAEGIQHPVYLGAGYGGIAGGSIPPPG